MNQQYVPNIGEFCNEMAKRDCIHIAVAPVVANCVLFPGDLVALDENGKAVDPDEENGLPAIGAVDPFLTTSVDRGDMFWLFLKPGSITGMRHVWSHPAFKPKAPVQIVREPDEKSV